MAMQAQYGVAAAYELEAQMRAMRDHGALLSAPANNWYDCAAVVSGAQSDLTCNNGRGGAVLGSRKRGREEVEQYMSPSLAVLPIPGMTKDVPLPPAVGAFAAASRTVESAMTSTSRRPAAASSFAGALVSELCHHNEEIDALVRVECERLRGGVEQAQKRQCQALVRTVTAAAARRMREKETELKAERQRAADLEERLRQALAERQAWCGLARSNEAVAAGLRATLDHVLRATAAPAEGFAETDPAAADDAQSCCFEAQDASKEDAASSAAGRWACKACGEREASVLLLPCRHLCLCKACEPRLHACPVCLAAKNACVVARSPVENL